MRIRILYFENFDGAGGRLNPAGVAFDNPVPVLAEFDEARPLGIATLSADSSGIVADLAIDVARVAGQFPAPGLRFRQHENTRIPRVITACRCFAIGVSSAPSADRRIVPLSLSPVKGPALV